MSELKSEEICLVHEDGYLQIDSKWLESFVRSIVIKTLSEVHWEERNGDKQ